MAFIKTTLLMLTFSAAAHATHTFHFKNSCPFTLTPMYKGGDDGSNVNTGPTLNQGDTGTASVAEIWNSGRLYAQDPKNDCAEPDGGGCTLAECSFGPADSNGNKWWQCNLSVVSGYNIPTKLGYVGGDEASCNTTFSCTNANCASTQAYRVGSGAASCSDCISQCNTAGVGLSIEYCPSGSTIPDMGQGSGDSSSSTTKSSSTKTSTSTKTTSSTSSTVPPASADTTSSSATSSSLTSSAANVESSSTPKKCPNRTTGKRKLKRSYHHMHNSGRSH